MVGHKLFPIQSCSLAGQKFICNGNKWLSSHAEINAIKCLPFKKLYDKKFCKKVTIFVCRFDPAQVKMGRFVMIDSKPCGHCLGIMNMFNIETIYYSAKDRVTFIKEKVTRLIKEENFIISQGHRCFL